MKIIKLEIPEILEDQEVVLSWVRNLKKQYIDFSTIVEALTSQNEVSSKIIAEGLDDAKKVYNRYNNSHRGAMLQAIILEIYRFENDINEGDVVISKYKDLVGFAYNIDYKERVFDLYFSTDKTDVLKEYNLDDFEVLKRKQ